MSATLDHSAPAARSLALAAAAAAGAVGGDVLAPHPVPGLIATVIACAGAVGVRHRARAGALAVLLLVASAAATVAGTRLFALRTGAVATAARAGSDALLTGTVVDEPARDAMAERAVIAVRRVSMHGRELLVRERVLLTVRPPPPVPLRFADIVRVDARLAGLAPARARGADADAAARRLLRRRIGARAYAGADGVERLGIAHGPLITVARAGRTAVRRAAGWLDGGTRGLFLGITVGDTSELDPVDEETFRTTGLSHLLAVSGANVAMVLGVIALALRSMGAGRRLTILSLSASLLSFVAITRFEASVVRAGAMAAIALAGLGVGARRAPLVALWTATAAVLLWEPALAFSVGLQLSVLATWGLLVITPRIRARLPPGLVWEGIAVTAGAQVAVSPLLVLQFGQISLTSVAANVIAAPLVAPVTVTGMVAAGAGAVAPPLAGLALVTAPMIEALRWVARAMSEIPLGALATPRGAVGIALALALALIALRVASPRTQSPTAPLLLALALVIGGGLAAGATTPRLDGLLVTMLDVGQGDAILVQAGRHSMLVDGGPDDRRLIAGLRARGVRRVDLLVGTHPHEDHVAGLDAVVRGFGVARALDPYIPAGLPSHQEFVSALRERGIPRDRAVAGMSYRLGAAAVDVLWPPLPRLEGTEEDVNNNSIVLRVRYGGDSVLLAGELQEEGQQALLERGAPAVQAAVLKVAHHGSRRMVPEFYRSTGARVALIPVGVNTFGHPHAQTLAALSGMTVLRSDRAGTVTVALDGRGAIRWVTERRIA